MSETTSLEDLRKQYPNYKSEQDRMPVGERPRAQANDRRIAWMQQYKPTCSADWFNFNRR